MPKLGLNDHVHCNTVAAVCILRYARQMAVCNWLDMNHIQPPGLGPLAHTNNTYSRRNTRHTSRPAHYLQTFRKGAQDNSARKQNRGGGDGSQRNTIQKDIAIKHSPGGLATEMAAVVARDQDIHHCFPVLI